jgi:hypothetical protein
MSDIISQEELENEIRSILLEKEDEVSGAFTAHQLAKYLRKGERTTRLYLLRAIERGDVVKVEKRVSGRLVPAYLPKGRTSWNPETNSNTKISANQTASIISQMPLRGIAESSKH